jgi:hypothetical protein
VNKPARQYTDEELGINRQSEKRLMLVFWIVIGGLFALFSVILLGALLMDFIRYDSVAPPIDTVETNAPAIAPESVGLVLD